MKPEVQTAIERLSQVAEQVERLVNAIERLAEVHNNIEQRLNSVLMPCGPVCNNQASAPQQQIVPLAQRLESITETVNKLRESMDNMLSRIEL